MKYYLQIGNSIILRIEANPSILVHVSHCRVISLGHKISPFVMFYGFLFKNEVGDPTFFFQKIISYTILYHYGKFQSCTMDFVFCMHISPSKNKSLLHEIRHMCTGIFKTKTPFNMLVPFID